MIARRNFLKYTALSSGMFSVSNPLLSLNTSLISQKHAPGPKIKKISVFSSSGSFYRFIGMNAYDTKPKGITGQRKSCLIELTDGTIGIGTIGYSRITEEVLTKMRQLLGKEIFSCYSWNDEKIIGISVEMQHFFLDTNIAWIESAILDAIGQLKKKPVWQLMGDKVKNGIDPYDGTLYFEDIANETDVSIITEIGKRIKSDGYRAIKIKIGRPDKWLPGEEGVNRDIEAIIALREAVGNNFNIMADANNGYKDKFDWAVKLLKACAPYRLYFMEELFPDNTDMYLKLRNILLEHNLFVPIAEGENIRDMEAFNSYISDEVYNYIQPDMATCGFSNILIASDKINNTPHIKLIPHVWQSQVGLIMSLHASKIHSKIPFVEDSRYQENIYDTSAYQFSEGQWFIPDLPGWGLRLNPDYKDFIIGDEITIA